MVSLSMSIGAPCEPVVKIGDTVKTGQLIADSDAFMSAPVHAPVTGVVTRETTLTAANGKKTRALVIETANKQELSDEVKPPVINSREDFLKAVRASGAVGQGGAGFPLHIKLGFDPKKQPVDYLLINGAECEPYTTSDYRELIERGEDVISGIKLILRHISIPKAIIGIESDKPLAIKKMRSLTENEPDISVAPLPTGYPQGAEKVLVYSCTKRVVNEGSLPVSAGCVVVNVSTTAFVARYIKTGVPLIEKRVSIDGDIVNKPENIFVPIGTTLAEITARTNLRLVPGKVIFGGMMMGTTVYDPDTPVTKTTGAILFFAGTGSAEKPLTSCIRCARCVNACSMSLAPTELEHAFDRKDAALLQKLHVNLCMDCGACSYVCPAGRNLAEKNQLAKAFLRSKGSLSKIG
jgi:electron transport complex protein RnfC